MAKRICAALTLTPRRGPRLRLRPPSKRGVHYIIYIDSTCFLTSCLLRPSPHRRSSARTRADLVAAEARVNPAIGCAKLLPKSLQWCTTTCTCRTVLRTLGVKGLHAQACQPLSQEQTEAVLWLISIRVSVRDLRLVLSKSGVCFFTRAKGPPDLLRRLCRPAAEMRQTASPPSRTRSSSNSAVSASAARWECGSTAAARRAGPRGAPTGPRGRHQWKRRGSVAGFAVVAGRGTRQREWSLQRPHQRALPRRHLGQRARRP